jgi:hypothetical protein
MFTEMMMSAGGGGTLTHINRALPTGNSSISYTPASKDFYLISSVGTLWIANGNVEKYLHPYNMFTYNYDSATNTVTLNWSNIDSAYNTDVFYLSN